MSLWGELKRRNVFKVGIAYLAFAWLVVQVASILVPAFELPAFVLPAAIVALAIGFPVVLVCSWVYELTPEGLARDEDVPAGAPSRLRVARRLDFAIIAVLSLALVTVVVDQYVIDRYSAPRFESIAVMPLVNLSRDPEQRYFADGMTEGIIGNLANLGALKVVSRTTVMQYRDAEIPIRELGTELGVEAIIEGSAERNADRVVISVRLVDAASDTIVWREIYNRAATDVLALHGAIAEDIATQIAIEIAPAERERLLAGAAVDAQAYDAYLRGLSHYYRLTPSDLDIAERYFAQARDLNASSALPWVGLARVWSSRRQMGFVAPAEAAPRVREYAELALSLRDPVAEAEAYYQLAVVRTWTDWDFDAAEPLFERAIELKPGFADARALYSHYLALRGRIDEALAEIDAALELDALNLHFRSLRGVVLHMAGRHGDAIAQANEALDVAPNLTLALLALSPSLFMTERYDEVVAVERRLLEIQGDGDDPRLAGLPVPFDEQSFRDVIRVYADIAAERARATGARAGNASILYLYAGDRAAAIDWLEESLAQREPNLPYLLRFPVYAPLLDEPRVQAVIEAVGI